MLLHLFARALTLHVLDFHDDDEFNIIDIAMSDSYPSTDTIFKRPYDFTLYPLFNLNKQFSRIIVLNEVYQQTSTLQV